MIWLIRQQLRSIGLLDCGGFRLQESVDALDSFGCVLAKQAEYADSVLQISAVMGNCAGGMTLIPAMSDFAFMTKESTDVCECTAYHSG